MHGDVAGRNRRNGERGERGVVMVLVAVMLVALIGFASLVFDMGQLYTVRGELQNTTDSASLAGALMLDKTEEGLDRAREEAIEYAARHSADFEPGDLSTDDVVFGFWDPAAETFTSLGTDPDPNAVNAVRVLDRRAEADDNAVTLKLAPVIGHTKGNVGTGATAISGGPATECGFPMTVPDCSLDTALDDGSCDFCFVYQEGGGTSQNAGWTDFGEGNVGTGTIADLVESACSDVDPNTGECIGQCLDSSAGDEIKGQHGNFMNKGNGPCPVIQDILLRNGSPESFVVRVPVFESTSSVCEDQNFSGHLNIEGYASLEIFGASCGNNDTPVIVESLEGACPAPPSGKYIVARLRCDLESEQPPGGGFFGLDSKRSRLVQ